MAKVLEIYPRKKPLNYTNLDGIKIYEIKFSERKNDYDFYNLDEIVEEFLMNIRDKFQNRPKNIILKSGFSIDNIQPIENSTLILDLRYWSAEPIQTKNFNDYV